MNEQVVIPEELKAAAYALRMQQDEWERQNAALLAAEAEELHRQLSCPTPEELARQFTI